MPQEKALHVGSGGHTLIGWINADIIMSAPTDIVFDIAEGFPFKSESFQWIHSEDLLEHLDQDTGRLFATEAFRVLKPGGVMRILTPDLYKIVKSVYQPYGYSIS
jgi:predicted SAM-dependent methyltransferase